MRQRGRPSLTTVPASSGWIAVEQMEEGEVVRYLVRVEPAERRLRVVELYMGGGAVTPVALRQIRLGALEDLLNLPSKRAELAETLAEPHLDTPPFAELIRKLENASPMPDFAGASDADLAAYDEAKAAASESRVRLVERLESNPQVVAGLAARLLREQKGRRPYPDEFYAAAARVYEAAIAKAAPPIVAIASAADVPRSTAERWVREARRRDFLPPTEPRKARGDAAAGKETDA